MWNSRLLSIIAIGLWVMTAAIAGYFFVVGITEPSADKRQSIVLTSDERDLILAEMRVMLSSVQGIVDGIASKKMSHVSETARRSGSAAVAQVPAGLMTKLPLSFKQLGHETHLGFDEIVVGAQSGEPGDILLTRLSTQLNNCIACHASYRLDTKDTVE